MTQYRWYYNAINTILHNHHGYDNVVSRKKFSAFKTRDLLRKYKYTEDTEGNITVKDFVFDAERDEIPIPEWWDNKVHNRIPRGAVNKFVSSLNSALTNKRNGNIKGFTMGWLTKKSPTEYVSFEDKCFPSFLRTIESRYWFTTRDHRRICIPFSDIDAPKRGLEIIHEKETDRYFIHYPVDVDWFPGGDRRRDSQVTSQTTEKRIISLDPGIRKFMVGYDPCGKCVFIGEGASRELARLLLDDKKYKETYSYRQRIKHMVDELHWKTISFLVSNYDTIILPDFRVSQMLRKRTLNRTTKRLMSMFSFHRFKERLQFKCSLYGKDLVIVDESYTSCTCGQCGTINRRGGNEVFHCSSCDLEMDRDIIGSRNIFIKNATLR